jgi:hypothetical protein
MVDGEKNIPGQAGSIEAKVAPGRHGKSYKKYELNMYNLPDCGRNLVISNASLISVDGRQSSHPQIHCLKGDLCQLNL